MKEIQKVVQKLSSGRQWRTNPYKNIKSPPVYRDDLITISHVEYMVCIYISIHYITRFGTNDVLNSLLECPLGDVAVI